LLHRSSFISNCISTGYVVRCVAGYYRPKKHSVTSDEGGSAEFFQSMETAPLAAGDIPGMYLRRLHDKIPIK